MRAHLAVRFSNVHNISSSILVGFALPNINFDVPIFHTNVCSNNSFALKRPEKPNTKISAVRRSLGGWTIGCGVPVVNTFKKLCGDHLLLNIYGADDRPKGRTVNKKLGKIMYIDIKAYKCSARSVVEG